MDGLETGNSLNPFGHVLGAAMAQSQGPLQNAFFNQSALSDNVSAIEKNIAPILGASTAGQKASYIQGAFQKAQALADEFFKSKIGSGDSRTTVSEYLKSSLGLDDAGIEALKKAYAGMLANPAFIQGEAIGTVTAMQVNSKLLSMLEQGKVDEFKQAFSSGAEFAKLLGEKTAYGSRTYSNRYVSFVMSHMFQAQAIFDFSLKQQKATQQAIDEQSKEYIEKWQKVITAGGEYEIVAQKSGDGTADYASTGPGVYTMYFRNKSNGQEYSFDVTGGPDGGPSGISISRLKASASGGLEKDGPALYSLAILPGMVLDKTNQSQFVLKSAEGPVARLDAHAIGVFDSKNRALSIGGNYLGLAIPADKVIRDAYGVPHELMGNSPLTGKPLYGRELEQGPDGQFYYKAVQQSAILQGSFASQDGLLTSRDGFGITPEMITKEQMEGLKDKYDMVMIYQRRDAGTFADPSAQTDFGYLGGTDVKYAIVEKGKYLDMQKQLEKAGLEMRLVSDAEANTQQYDALFSAGKPLQSGVTDDNALFNAVGTMLVEYGSLMQKSGYSIASADYEDGRIVLQRSAGGRQEEYDVRLNPQAGAEFVLLRDASGNPTYGHVSNSMEGAPELSEGLVFATSTAPDGSKSLEIRNEYSTAIGDIDYSISEAGVFEGNGTTPLAVSGITYNDFMKLQSRIGEAEKNSPRLDGSLAVVKYNDGGQEKLAITLDTPAALSSYSSRPGFVQLSTKEIESMKADFKQPGEETLQASL